MYELTSDGQIVLTEAQEVLEQDAGNPDWQEFLQWLWAGNVPAGMTETEAENLLKQYGMEVGD